MIATLLPRDNLSPALIARGMGPSKTRWSNVGADARPHWARAVLIARVCVGAAGLTLAGPIPVGRGSWG